MKYFFKVFFIALICFSLAIGAAFYSFNKFYDPVVGQDLEEEDGIEQEINEKPESELTTFEKAIKESDRINVLLLGLENENRSDTMIVASYDPDTKLLDLISVPRDTYYHEKGHDDGGNRKLNAKHARSGPSGTRRAVENILGIPIHHYVSVKYEGVKEIVDVINGVEVNVPFHMKYSDPTDTPPLYIDIPKGKQVLNGEQANQFLRYRKNSDGKQGYVDGDIGRIKAQQEFIKSAVKKALGFKLPKVITTAFNYIKTDMSLAEVLKLTPDAIGFSMDNISAALLPGRAKYININGANLSFYLHDPEAVKELMMKLYDVKKDNDNE